IYIYTYIYIYTLISKGPPIQFPGRARPPTSFGAPPGAPSAPNAPSYSPMGFSNAPPTSFGMPQPYSQAPYPIQPSHPFPGNAPNQTNTYPPQQMPYPQSIPTCYPPDTHSNQSAPSPYPQQQNYNSYPNLQTAPDAKEYFSNITPSPYPSGPNAHTANSIPYQRDSYPGGQGVSSQYPYAANPTAATRGTTPAPRRNQFTSKTSPTVVPSDGFDARADAEILRKAMKGFGTDEKAIIHVLANRSNLQRQEIASQFKTLYGKDLIKDLKSELSGNFEKLVLALMMPLPQFYAKELHDAMSGLGTDETVLIEVLCTMSNHEISIIKQAYEARELRFGTDESTFNAILVQRNMAQLRQIFQEYHNITGHDIDDAIENEFSGDIKKGLLAIVKCVKNRAGFFAEQLYKSMKGIGTDDNRLIRLVVTRCEVDMGEIKNDFLHQYKESLEDFISGDCSGHYKKCLLALIQI
ncbi:ANX11 protein, partial [Acromyrmex heyeri]